MELTRASLARLIDHAALKPELTAGQIRQACQLAARKHLFGIAVNPVWIPDARAALSGTDTHVVAVVGFPLGASHIDIKLAEAVKAASDGAAEIDMVANIGWLVGADVSRVEAEIRQVRDRLPFNVVLKVIIEATLLSPAQMTDAARAVVNGGAQYVKTSTGFSGGATVEQIRSLKAAVGDQIKIKASGGIKSSADCIEMIDAGADRLGTSSSAAILDELPE